jgi:SAM-dependent methyltransferase
MSAERLALPEPTPHIDDERLRRYWDMHIHDDQLSTEAVGSPQFFEDLDRYRFQKLEYLPRVVDFTAYRDCRLLEIGCGIGIDLVRFARHGAIVTGIDVSPRQIELARANLACHGLDGDLRVMNGERLDFPDASFDVVYAHGVLQYTPAPRAMIHEIHRVLRIRGEAILMVYNRYSWLRFLSFIASVELEHERSPHFHMYSLAEFRKLLGDFSRVDIVPERFPVRSRLHHGLKAALYNRMFVGLFNTMPRVLVRPLGWHLMARVLKGQP